MSSFQRPSTRSASSSASPSASSSSFVRRKTISPKPSSSTSSSLSAASSSASHEQAHEYPKWHNIVAGAAAGAGARLFTAPLDLLKIRRQLQSSPLPSSSIPSSIPSSSKLSFSPFGMFSAFQNIVQKEGGFKSLFRGNLAATYLWIGYAAVQFSLYAKTADFLTSFAALHSNTSSSSFLPNLAHLPHPAKSILEPPARFATDLFSAIGSNPTAKAFCSGAAAGTAATLATYPFDICRTAFASQNTQSQATKSISTFFQLAMTHNPHVHPLRTLFAGSGPAVLGIVPYMGLNFALYDYLVNRGRKVQVMDAGVAGAIAGGTSKLLVYPLDTVKKRLQAQAFETFWGKTGQGGGELNLVRSKVYRNMVDCGMKIAKEEGVQAFYRGLVPTVAKTMVATSLTFSIFTFTKNRLEGMHDWSRTRRRECQR